YTGIPLNEVGLLRAESWTPDQDALPENGRCYWPLTSDCVSPLRSYTSTRNWIVQHSRSLRTTCTRHGLIKRFGWMVAHTLRIIHLEHIRGLRQATDKTRQPCDTPRTISRIRA